MHLGGLHLLLTYQCTFECDHCFVWGSPQQSGTMTLPAIRRILQQGRELGTVKSVYFEGGEPFLYYATLLASLHLASDMGFQVGIVSNAYWATSQEDALACLQPMQGLLHDLTVSSDLFHADQKMSRQAQNAQAAAARLGIATSVISIARPDVLAPTGVGQLPPGEGGVMYRGRAAEKLAHYVAPLPWTEFTTCPHEQLADPGRVHVDALGNLHLCQGLSLGNLFERSLVDICTEYDANHHPIVGPLLQGGPAELARRYGVAHAESYADACHLCDQTRRALRAQFPGILGPDQMYGVSSG